MTNRLAFPGSSQPRIPWRSSGRRFSGTWDLVGTLREASAADDRADGLSDRFRILMNAEIESQATYFTVSDRSFFPGTVALLNSLRLTGNRGSFVVVDVGLEGAQRSRLARHGRVVTAPSGVTRPLFKALPQLFDPRGAIVILDSDMLVTDHLGPVVLKAAEGKICVFPDHISQTGRWFPEWQSVLGLKAPLRRQTYVNSGFIALSVDHWPSFLPRFWDLSERVPLESVFAGPDMDRPFWTADQDTLNALLMSEIPPTAVEILPASDEVYPDGLMDTKVVDLETLECIWAGRRPKILHHSMNPKVWAPGRMAPSPERRLCAPLRPGGLWRGCSTPHAARGTPALAPSRRARQDDDGGTRRDAWDGGRDPSPFATTIVGGARPNRGPSRWCETNMSRGVERGRRDAAFTHEGITWS